MPSNLTQKEKMLLEDQKKHEEICIQKYQNYSAQVQDPQLKQLLSNYAQQEQEHLNSLNQLLSGQLPSINQQQSGSQQQSNLQQGMQSQPTNQGVAANQRDASLLNDLLMTEKYVSGTYDTAIFEMTSSNVRQVLNHIQKEEQQHGEGIFNYMNSHGMYNPQ